jgi:hypothetical protein
MDADYKHDAERQDQGKPRKHGREHTSESLVAAPRSRTR